MAAAATHVVTGKVRLSYCHLNEPQAANDAIPGSKPRYNTTILIPKSDRATKQKIDAAIEAAKQNGQSTKFGGKIPALLPTPVHDGDGTRPSDGEPYGDECKGCWVIAAGTTTKPRIVDTNLNDILDPNEIYSGMYAKVSLDFFPYAATTKKGIGVALGNIQKVADGEAFTSRASVEDDFGSSDDDFF